jgi:tetratricopeptide (TPR) repeat protein
MPERRFALPLKLIRSQEVLKMPTAGSCQETRVEQIKLTIPTYELLPDDRNPILDKWLDPYPYTMQNHVSRIRTEKEYDAVILENKYLKLTVLPSLGGRLYSAVDKRMNRELLYRNTVIRPRLIGTRGAWSSGGIEFNFPISHSPTTSDRVNCLTRSYEDGSAAVIFGSIEQMSYMNWKVELRLYPDKAYIEQNVTLYNPTPLENKYYFWTNAAVEYNKSLQLIYPFDWCVNFDKNYVKWPFYQNKDCRNPSEISSSFETFGKLTMDNFFGIYNRDKAFGLVHYANRKKIKGAKFFIWGNDQNAKVWNRSLTDNDSQYIEIQSGPFETQSVYKWMRPHQEQKWSEYWYPVFGMDGFKHAEKEVVLNVEKRGNGVRLTLLANEPLNGCRLELKIGGEIYCREADLTPERAVEFDFEVEGAFELDELKFDLYNQTKHLVNMGDRREMTDEYPDTDVYEDSRVGILNEDLHKTLKQGQMRESLGLTSEALEYYLNNLQSNPSCTISLNRAGLLYLKSMQYPKAEHCFRSVLSNDNRNSQARFALAAMHKELGEINKARRLFMDIAADSELYQASIKELIKLDLLLGYWQEAQGLAELLYGGGSYGAFLESIAYRKDGLTAKSRQLLETMPSFDEFILAEAFLLDSTDSSREQLAAFTSCDENSLLPIALDYLEMGLAEDAEALLSLVNNPSMKTKIALGICKKSAGQGEIALLQAIKEEPLDHVFLKERLLLRELANLQDKDETGKARYLLGTFYYTAGRKDDGLDQLLAAYGQGLRYSPLLHTIGYIYYHHIKEIQAAEAFFAEDIAIHSPVNEGSLVYLDRIYQQNESLEQRVALIPYMEGAINKSLILVPLVNILKESGQEEQALWLLENEEFDNWEGLDASGRCYRDFVLHMVQKEMASQHYSAAKIWMDRVREYPENLNYGERAGECHPDIHYFSGILHSLLEEDDLAMDEFRKGAGAIHFTSEALPETLKRYSLMCTEELRKREPAAG